MHEEKPTYKERLKKTQELELEVRRENTKLKKLLKECRRYIDIWGYTDTHGKLLLPQIDQALGEDK